jgi:hypothetical protein
LLFFVLGLVALLGLGYSSGCAPENMEAGDCVDRFDNDLDGAADFDDSDCQDWGNCMDAADNDGDGLVDQDDPGCSTDSVAVLP